MPRDERGRWVRLPRTPANKTFGFGSSPHPPPTKSGVTTVVTNSRQVVTQFVTDRRSRGLSPRTCEFYQGYLTRFINGVGTHLLAVTKEDIASFMDSLQCNAGGKHAYFRTIRAFYKWAHAEDMIAALPRMVAPKVPKPLRYAVNVDDINKLLEAADGVRDRLIVSLLADTGLRRAELCSVNWVDVDQERDTIRVWGKGAKQRLVRYGPQTRY